MSEMPNLDFRRLERLELELAAELTAAPESADPKSENFGTVAIGPQSGEEIWGLFIKGTLAGAAQSGPVSGDAAEIKALFLARRWRRTGLSVWMLEQLCREAGSAGARNISVRIDGAPFSVGEVLEDAGFSGPDREDERYPAGTWTRSALSGGK